MFARKISHPFGNAWEIEAPAKVNLYLEILGRPTEGFHPLETLMVPVRIFDQLRWVDSSDNSNYPEGCSLEIHDCLSAKSSVLAPLSAGPDNLILRAVNRLAQVAGVEARGRFQLTKRIPMQAGLGGGSSDAAAALLLANQGWQLDYSRPQLMEVAAEIGSDVPYFLSHGPAICRGRGEIIESITGLPRMHFVIVKPPIGLSTADVFSHLQFEDQEDLSSSTKLNRLLELLRKGAISQASSWMTNRLEHAARQLSPWIERLHTAFENCGCYTQLMTGSGSSYIGIMRSARQARRVASQLAGQQLGNVFATASC